MQWWTQVQLFCINYCWLMFFPLPTVVRQRCIREMGTFILFLCQVSWRCCVPKIIKIVLRHIGLYIPHRNIYAVGKLNRQETQLSPTNLRDAFIGQSILRSPNIAPFHMWDIVSHCAIVTLSLRYSTSKCGDLEIGVKGHSRSLRVVSFDRLCMV